MPVRIGIVTLFAFLLSCSQSFEPNTKDGIVTLPDGLWKGTSSIEIEGPWEFYWARLLLPGDFKTGNPPRPDLVIPNMRSWKNFWVNGAELGQTGRATYRMRLQNNQWPDQMGIFFPHQVSASRLYVNGILLVETGTIGQTLAEDVAFRRNTLAYFRPPRGEIEIVLQISNAEALNGGMRGHIRLGDSESVRRYAEQRTLFEILVFGIVLGSAIYHLFFYLMHRGEFAFLSFSLLCFVLAARIPLLGSKFYLMVFPEIPWELQARVHAFLTIAAAPLGIAFLRGIFADRVSRRTLIIYSTIAAAASLIQLGDLSIIATGNLVYATVMYPIVGVHIFFVIFHSWKAEKATLLMAVGIGGLLILGCVAIYQNFHGREGAPYALAAILFFAMFQALALSRFFLSAVRARSELAERLQESHMALSKQREDLQIHLHDSLGGALTDLQIHAERKLASAPVEMRNTMLEIQERVIQTVKMFRSQLLFMEDLAMAAEEVLPGIQMTLLRRYADAGREIDFDCTPAGIKLLNSAEHRSFPVKRRLDLFFLIIELCTNDLKHGRGESFWRISAEAKQLRLVQKNGMIKSPATPTQHPKRAADRVQKLGGKMQVTIENDEYGIQIWIPF
ncbi:MAG: 7TM-DISM domain-containing protein [Leptospirales bacterium]|nr:7TM-DISM domain-containing protein [Leptospirales bacterium]